MAAAEWRSTVSNISGKNANAGTGVRIKGLPEHKLRGITLRNIHLTADNAMTCCDVEDLTVEELLIESVTK